MNPLRWFPALFNWLRVRLGSVGDKLPDYISRALPIVRMIATLTPNRTDDEIIDLFDRVGMGNVTAWLSLPISERGSALARVALEELRKHYPNVPLDQLNAAINLALTLHRAQSPNQ